MTELLNLGKLYVSDFLADGEQPRAEPAELRLVMDDDTGVVHLAEQPPAELMWGRYWYRSGTNQSMRDELAGIVAEVGGVVALDDGDRWVDIACNDGTLLAEVPSGVMRIGVDPVEGVIRDAAALHADWLIPKPFTSDVGAKIARAGQVKVVTCIAMFYDLLDPTDFLAGVHYMLARDGLFVIQVSYTPLMLDELAFDNICHEHARYYTLATLSSELLAAGFIVVDAQMNDTNGGSMRVYCRRTDGDPATFGTQPHRVVARARARALHAYEDEYRYNEPRKWLRFAHQLENLRAEVVGFVMDCRARGETVWGYGASTKGNTLLQYLGLDHTMIDAIAERQDAKVGLRTVGTDIPIVSEDEWRAARPDYTLMLPWHFVAEFTAREAGYLAAGGRFIVPCPRFEVIGDGPAMLDGQRPA
jgi:hypothetical protein